MPCTLFSQTGIFLAAMRLIYTSSLSFYQLSMPSFSSITLALVLGSITLPAFAGPDIDVVYGDDIARRGEVAVELAARWTQTSHASALGGRALWQAVGELAYGVSDNFNLGIKLPVSHADGHWHADGAYAEAKYMAPHAADGFYWGAEIEAGSIKPAGEERSLSLEAFPIFGYRTGHWHVIGNPGVEYSSEGEDRGWSFAPKAKVSYSLNSLHALGLEYHVDAGKFGDFAPRSKRSETAFLTWDAKIVGKQMNVALGHGATRGSDRWAVRIGIELDD